MSKFPKLPSINGVTAAVVLTQLREQEYRERHFKCRICFKVSFSCYPLQTERECAHSSHCCRSNRPTGQCTVRYDTGEVRTLIAVGVPGFCRFESERFRSVAEDLGIEIEGLSLEGAQYLARLILGRGGSYNDGRFRERLEELGVTTVNAINELDGAGELKTNANDDMSKWEETLSFYKSLVRELQSEFGSENVEQDPELELAHQMIQLEDLEEARANGDDL
eukprot:TRINITY_DN226_c0_g1_i1.p1 TRINITY_DN226_c0_g1~~TRINITY_DN226_c0_g1_i1.p1  ORF type:complete len:222 (+),score=12.36 TRINITY_DN226_c0_g1_i1:91-756(+)